MSLGLPKRKSKKPRAKAGGTWIFVEDENLTPEQKAANLEEEKDQIMSHIVAISDPKYPFARLDEFHDYFPGNQEVPKEGAWILVKKCPPTEYTVPPLSIWFATPWPMKGDKRMPHRVKLVTPKGDLGMFPHEYALVTDMSKYWEFMGQGMTARFFGNDKGIPADQLHYIRSRGISKRDAIIMLVGNIKAHGVLWFETAPEIGAQFGYKWPKPERLATHNFNEKSHAERGGTKPDQGSAEAPEPQHGGSPSGGEVQEHLRL